MKNEIYASHGDYQRKRRWRNVFDSVVTTYRSVLSTSPLVACSYDEYARPHKLGPALLEFKADVEHATMAALKSQALFAIWQRIVEEDESVPSATFAQIASKCGKIFESRGLPPHQYFTKVKRGRPDRRPALKGAAA